MGKNQKTSDGTLTISWDDMLSGLDNADAGENQQQFKKEFNTLDNNVLGAMDGSYDYQKMMNFAGNVGKWVNKENFYCVERLIDKAEEAYRKTSPRGKKFQNVLLTLAEKAPAWAEYISDEDGSRHDYVGTLLIRSRYLENKGKIRDALAKNLSAWADKSVSSVRSLIEDKDTSEEAFVSMVCQLDSWVDYDFKIQGSFHRETLEALVMKTYRNDEASGFLLDKIGDYMDYSPLSVAMVFSYSSIVDGLDDEENYQIDEARERACYALGDMIAGYIRDNGLESFEKKLGRYAGISYDIKQRAREIGHSALVGYLDSRNANMPYDYD